MKVISFGCIISTAFAFMITSENDEKKFVSNSSGKAVMTTTGKPAEFTSTEVSPGVDIITDKSTGKVLDMQGGGSNVIFWGKHGGANQRFSIVKNNEGGYYIKSENKCLEYDASGKMYRTTCSNKSEQRFSIIYTPGEPQYKPPVEVPVEVPVPVENPAPPQPQILIFNTGKPSSSKSHDNHHRSQSSEDSSLLYDSGLIG
ncbi:uncharacterized protein Eint_081680 [Encephalitozoon intestinalis ATCC 50506]|uniref:Ricin B lectin domain-containing protein n=1 Tax=Encephalitozoon intestinalis (strain ATCC 50506) TaxID=876142 RepID=E0S8R2_ENCIT|nr:uncharacterized protein Eint_081680 [Encephalitozoon intestinalis ATCC 50506]ADM12100.1 hypothetical protein Eint_081680 [Encephalitozoon intestinalis ATCC 50506]UTX45893.1 ricin B-type lectin domain-containing protein [Encephalitozoon intestinalis]